MVKLFGYRLSDDRVGLLKYHSPFRCHYFGSYIHIHSDELSFIERLIHRLLVILG